MTLVEASESNIGRQARETEMSVFAPSDQNNMDIACLIACDISEIEADWRQLESNGVKSPGQSFDFIKQWIDSFDIPAADQRFAVVSLDGEPIILLALQYQRIFGARVLAPFPGSHVGCAPPLVDVERMAGLSEAQQTALWRSAVAHFDGVDAIYLPYVPASVAGQTGIYDQLGLSVPADTLYRSTFESWEQCDSEQRSRSRRKHDKQQGARLLALGEVEFEELDAQSELAGKVLECMFFQRARRFAVQGIRDPFADEAQRSFYAEALAGKGTLRGVLHVLRLNGNVVAVRYNLVHQDKMFCLISSMSDDPKIQTGSPGKQCLLRVMQSVFGDEVHSFDMGAGLTDEKRHWCNEQISLRHYYVPLTLVGRIFVAFDRLRKTVRYRLKNDERLSKFLKSMRGYVHRLRPKANKAS